MKTNPDWNSILEAASGDVRRLDFVERYSSIPVTNRETVSAHSFWVALYSILIHRAVMPDDTKLVGPILAKAIIHDLPEAVSGDVVRTFKYSSQILKESIDKAEEMIIENFSEPIRDIYGYYEKESGYTSCGDQNPDYLYIEAVIKAADFLSLQQYMNREWLRGNREFETFFERMIDDLNNIGVKVSKSSDPRVQNVANLYFLMAEKARSSKTYTA